MLCVHSSFQCWRDFSHVEVSTIFKRMNGLLFLSQKNKKHGILNGEIEEEELCSNCGTEGLFYSDYQLSTFTQIK